MGSGNDARNDQRPDAGFDAAMQRALDRLNSSTSKARRSINDLIDLRAIELGALQIVRKPTDLKALVEYAVRGFSLHARRRIAIEAKSSLMVLVDAARLTRVISRLIDVALATAFPRSQILIRVERQAKRAMISVVMTASNSMDVVRLVADSEGNDAREHRGERLGIFVAHCAVEAHGGRLSAVELPGVGTRLSVDLPLPLDPVMPRVVNASAGSAVLLVDDNADQLTAFAKLLRADGMRPEVASSGQDALAQIRRQAPDVLVVDGQLPDMTGADVIESARRLLPHLPAVVVTGYPPHHPTIVSALAASHGAYVAKPVDLSVFYRELEKVLPRRSTAKAL
jgi:two-component system sensor histidine kinase EvgS